MSKIYYNQGDSRWANHPYPANADGYRDKTVKSSGCGPTCGAMIVSSTREIITPDKMCDISRENGYRVAGGTMDSFFDYVAKRWGFEMKRLHSSFEAHQACKDGYFVVICCNAGLWTTGGHYILAVGANDTEIEIYDPYLYNGKFNRAGREGIVRLVGNSAWVEINKFKANSNAQRFFAFKVDMKEEPAPAPAPAPQKEESKVAWVNTNTSPLNVRNSAGGAVIGSLPKGTQVLVYEVRDGWARIGNGKWVSNSYLAYSQPQAKPSIPNTVGQTRTFKAFTYMWSNSNLTGTRYDYKANTQCKILENISASVDKVNIPKTGRTAYVSTSAYKEGGSSTPTPAPAGRNTVGQVKVLKSLTTLYANSNLTGTQYTYKAGTACKVLQNVNDSVDKICATATGRIAYVRISAYR